MAKVVRTFSELINALESVRDKALEDTGKEAKELVDKEIQKEVYSIPEGTSENAYERTGELRRSLTDFPLEHKGNAAEVKIGHNWLEMYYNVSKFQHASPYWSPWNYTKYVAQTVHDGTSGSLFGEGHWRKPKPYMDNAKEEMKNGKYKEMMMKQLRKQGYKVR